jgi:hypothetical protein
VESGLTLSAVGPIAIAARVSMRGGERRLTVVAKATCEIVPDAPLSPCEPRPIVVGERAGDAPGSSARHPGDAALSLPRAQLLVLGAAYAEGGIPQTMDTVRLVVSRGASTLVDKRLSVVGDRRGPARAVAPSAPELVGDATPFLRIPLVYERAFGGPGYLPNPAGTGIAAERDGRAFLPNVYHAHGGGSAEAPGFGPISARWASRERLLGGTPPSAADLDVVARLSPDLDPAYFLSAPADQQLDRWEGGETIGLYHLHPSWPWLYFDVPRWGVAAVLTDRQGARAIVPMPLDTLLVTPEDLSVELTYRGNVAVAADGLRGARVDVALVDPDAEAAANGAAAADPPPPAGSPVRPLERAETQELRRVATQELELTPGLRPAPASTPPPRGESSSRKRGGTMVIESTPPPPPAEPSPAAPRRRPHTHSGTMILEQTAAPSVLRADGDERLRFEIEDESTQVLPDDGPPPASETTTALRVDALRAEMRRGETLPFVDPVTDPVTDPMVEPSAARRPRAVTMSIELSDEAPPSMPFEKRARTTSPSNRPGAPIPGAPWSPSDGPRPRPAEGIEQTDGDVTHAEDVVAPEPATSSAAVGSPASAPPPAPEPLASPAPAVAAPPAEAKRDPWRVDPPEAPPAPRAPAAPPRRPSFKAGLYKNVKK